MDITMSPEEKAAKLLDLEQQLVVAKLKNEWLQTLLIKHQIRRLHSPISDTDLLLAQLKMKMDLLEN